MENKKNELLKKIRKNFIKTRSKIIDIVCKMSFESINENKKKNEIETLKIIWAISCEGAVHITPLDIVVTLKSKDPDDSLSKSNRKKTDKNMIKTKIEDELDEWINLREQFISEREELASMPRNKKIKLMKQETIENLKEKTEHKSNSYNLSDPSTIIKMKHKLDELIKLRKQFMETRSKIIDIVTNMTFESIKNIDMKNEIEAMNIVYTISFEGKVESTSLDVVVMPKSELLNNSRSKSNRKKIDEKMIKTKIENELAEWIKLREQLVSVRNNIFAVLTELIFEAMKNNKNEYIKSIHFTNKNTQKRYTYFIVYPEYDLWNAIVYSKLDNKQDFQLDFNSLVADYICNYLTKHIDNYHYYKKYFSSKKLEDVYLYLRGGLARLAMNKIDKLIKELLTPPGPIGIDNTKDKSTLFYLGDLSAITRLEKNVFLNRPKKPIQFIDMAIIDERQDWRIKKINLEEYISLPILFFYIFLRKMSNANNEDIQKELSFADTSFISKAFISVKKYDKIKDEEEISTDLLMKRIFLLHWLYRAPLDIAFTPVEFSEEAINSLCLNDIKIRNYDGKNYETNKIKYNKVNIIKNALWEIYEFLRNKSIIEEYKIDDENIFEKGKYVSFEFYVIGLPNKENLIKIHKLSIIPSNHDSD